MCQICAKCASRCRKCCVKNEDTRRRKQSKTVRIGGIEWKT